MKKADVKIGATYRAKVSGKLVDVRIDAECTGGGWTATNLATKKSVRIKSAQRLRAMSGGSARAVAAADQQNARVREERKKSPDGQTASERAMGASGKTKRGARSKVAGATKGPAKAAKDKPARQGALGAAARFLAEAKEPASVGDITTAILERGWWKTNGKTPSATLDAAIHREIQTRGKDARFAKVDRGRFTLRKGA
jgi:hypothetical protein